MAVPFNPRKLKVFPLAQRQSLARLEDILIPPDSAPPPCPDSQLEVIRRCARHIVHARKRGAGVLLIYGAHLIKNGAAAILIRLLQGGWVTHLATNGAGAIHDWEFSFAGVSTESVRANVATGTFGTWDETGRSIHLALLAGGIAGEGFGRALGRFVSEDGVRLPSRATLADLIRSKPKHARTAARADLLYAMETHHLEDGRQKVIHPWKESCVLAKAFRQQVPLTIHPGIGYDIISNHPMFHGAAIGRAAGLDFCQFAGAVEELDGGVVLSIGSAIMGPQVFEKTLSCVNNLRRQEGRRPVGRHHIYVIDLQDGGNWDWSQGEPPKDNPAYYLRFCKSYSRMGGLMTSLQIDNALFLHHLSRELS